MKKIGIIFLLSFCLLLLFSACDSEKTEEKKPSVAITANYVAGVGGRIEGNCNQSLTVSEGKSAIFESVTAVANEGYRFFGWSDGRKTETRRDVLSESTTFTAVFESLGDVTIKYIAGFGGTIEGEAIQTVPMASSTTLVVAVPNEGYKFIGWSDGNMAEARTDASFTDKELYASFKKIVYATIEYTSSLGGYVEGETKQTLAYGEATSEVTAIANEGYRFINWSDGVKNATRSDIVKGDKTIKAMFSSFATIKYEATKGGTIEGEATQALAFGSKTSEVTAVCEEGYEFRGWSDGVMTPTRQDTVSKSITYTAIFVKDVVLSFACDATRGTLTGVLEQPLESGMTSSEVTATPLEGYQFVCWSDGTKTPTIKAIAEDTETLVAYFSEKSTGLSVVSIKTETGKDVTSKTEYIGCTVVVYDNEGNEHHAGGEARIRGRGNSTWNYDKKPYKIKFDKKQNLLGFGKAKDWVLLANYIDRSLIRNYLTYRVAKQMSSLSYSPDCELVEVYLNGEYRGVYLLCEQVEVNKHRVEVNEDATLVDTGFLIEMDEWRDGVCIIVNDKLAHTLSDGNRDYVIKAPDEDVLTKEQIAFIKDYLTKAIKAAEGDDYDAVCELIDVKSFAQAYIIFEMFKCADIDYSSFFMYKDAEGKLCCGPVWDFDMGMGNFTHKANSENTRRYDYLWSREGNPWFNALLQHKEFELLVGNELHAHKEIIEKTLDELFVYVFSKMDSMDRNFEDAWHLLGEPLWTNPYYFNEYKHWEEHAYYVKDYLESSLKFLLKTYPGGK